MIDDVEELRKMYDILTTKLIYFTSINKESTLRGLMKNLKRVSERIGELEKKKDGDS